MFAPFTAGLEVSNLAWSLKCREEDLAHRALENERRQIDNARRSVDEKSQQLKAIANQSALIAGFAMVVMVEVQIKDTLNGWLLAIFGLTSSIVIGTMVIAMLNCTFMLVAILRYDCDTREVPFKDFWSARCEHDFIFALRSFTLGVPVFLLSMAELGWVVFDGHPALVPAASLITAVAVIVLAIWYTHIERKWTGFLLNADGRLYDPAKKGGVVRGGGAANGKSPKGKKSGGGFSSTSTERVKETGMSKGGGGITNL